MRKRLGKSQAAVTEEGWTLRWSGTYEVYGDRWMPAWVEFTFGGIDQPQVRGRIEVRTGARSNLWRCNGAAHLTSGPSVSRTCAACSLMRSITDLVASLSFRHEYRRGAPLPEPPERMTEHDPAFEAARRFVTEHRKPRDYRVMNFPVLLMRSPGSTATTSIMRRPRP